MNKRVVAIVGSYRKGGVTETAVEAILEGARAKGADAQFIRLSDYPLEFCTNCRRCTQDPGEARGTCAQSDGLEEILRSRRHRPRLAGQLLQRDCDFPQVSRATARLPFLAVGAKRPHASHQDARAKGCTGRFVGRARIPHSVGHRRSARSQHYGARDGRENGGQAVDRSGRRRAASQSFPTRS